MSKILRSRWVSCIVQSLFATVVIFVICLALNGRRPAIMASLGATACIVFSMPSCRPARPRNVIWGHIIGLICGAVFLKIGAVFSVYPAVIYSLAVGFSILIMVLTDTDHPPAAGTALGIAMNGITIEVTAAVILSAIGLSIARNLFRPYIRDIC